MTLVPSSEVTASVVGEVMALYRGISEIRCWNLSKYISEEVYIGYIIAFLSSVACLIFNTGNRTWDMQKVWWVLRHLCPLFQLAASRVALWGCLWQFIRNRPSSSGQWFFRVCLLIQTLMDLPAGDGRNVFGMKQKSEQEFVMVLMCICEAFLEDW